MSLKKYCKINVGILKIFKMLTFVTTYKKKVLVFQFYGFSLKKNYFPVSKST